MPTNVPALPARRAITAAVSAATLLALLLTAILLTGSADAQNNRSISNLTATSAVPGQIAVDWDDVHDAKDYRVMWAKEDDPYKTWTDLTGNHFPTVSNYTITGLEEGETYKLKVRARFEEDGSGPWSQPVTALVASTPRPPDAPTGLAASLVFHDNVVLDWDDPDDDSIIGYKILRRNTDEQDPDEFTTVEANTGSQSTRYTDSSVGPETNYAYHIRAINDDGESDPSSNLNVTTPEEPEVEVVDPDPPAAPTGLSASALQPTTVVLDWDDTDDENVDGYQILRRNQDGKERGDGNGPTEFSVIVEDTESTDTSHRDSSATEETRYEYQVKARWGSLLSDASNTVQVETPPLRKGRSTHDTDPSLSSITVDGNAVPGFASDRTSYEYGVASTVTQVTIAATTTDADAEWEVTSPADADSAAGHQVNLTAGQNAVTIRGTSEDGNHTEDYTLNVNQGTTDTFGWKASDDIDTLIAAGNENPTGIWANDSHVWVLDVTDDHVYVYTRAGVRDTSQEFDLDAENSVPWGLTSDGEIIWVSDYDDHKLYAYGLASRQREEDRDIALSGLFDGPADISTHSGIIWMVELGQTSSYAYATADGSRLETRDAPFQNIAGSRDAYTEWNDGITTWSVYDPGGPPAVLASNIADGSRDSTKDFNTVSATGALAPGYIWSDGVTMLYSSVLNYKIYAFNMPVSDNTDLRVLTVDGTEVPGPRAGVTDYLYPVNSDVAQVTVIAEAAHFKATAAITAPADADTTDGHQVNLTAGQYTDVTIDVTAQDSTTETHTLKLYRGDTATDFAWNVDNDITTLDATGNHSPTGIWFGTSNIYIADDEDDKIYAYGLDHTPDSASDIETLTGAGNDSPGAIWSDGATIWVVDIEDNVIYAYDLSTGVRQPSREFTGTELDSLNTQPRGIWSDGQTLYVKDHTAKIFAYDLTTRSRESARDTDALTSYWGLWSDGGYHWSAAGAGVSIANLRAGDLWSDTTVTGHGFDTLQAAGFEPANTLDLWSDGDVMWVLDKTNPRVRSFNMKDSEDARLRSIEIAQGSNDAVEIENFHPNTDAYDVPVDTATTQITVSATVLHGEASATITPADASTDPGHQVNTPRGDTTVTVTVTAEDSSTGDYTITVKSSLLSDDPSLSSITVDSTAVPGFAHDRTSYEYGVASTTTQVTIAATTTDADAEWEVTSPADADSAAGHQVNLTAGQNAVTIRGTSEDGNHTEDYTLNVNQGTTDTFGWKAVDDIDTLIAAGNETPTGIWANDSHVWVLDVTDDHVYVYTRAGVRDTSQEFDLDAENSVPWGLTSDGEIIWVSDYDDYKLYAYGLTSRQREESRDIALSGLPSGPADISSHSGIIWVVPEDQSLSYAYATSDGSRLESRDIRAPKVANSAGEHSQWNDGITAWGVHSPMGVPTVLASNVADGSRASTQS